MRPRSKRNRGATTVEFALVGIPIIFTLVSVFEMARGMWVYETLAHAVREGARYAAVHGQDCVNSPNICSENFGTANGTILGIGQVIQNAGVGLDPGKLRITVSVGAGASTLSTKGPESLTTLLADSGSFSNWLVGVSPNQTVITGPGNDVVVTGVYPFQSALAMFWPGSAPVNFQTVNFGAVSRERIMF